MLLHLWNRNFSSLWQELENSDALRYSSDRQTKAKSRDQLQELRVSSLGWLCLFSALFLVTVICILPLFVLLWCKTQSKTTSAPWEIKELLMCEGRQSALPGCSFWPHSGRQEFETTNVFHSRTCPQETLRRFPASFQAWTPELLQPEVQQGATGSDLLRWISQWTTALITNLKRPN